MRRSAIFAILKMLSERAASQARLCSFVRCAVIAAVLTFGAGAGFGQNKYDRRDIGKVDINLGGNEDNLPVTEPFRSIITETIGQTYSSTRIRDSIQALHNTTKVASVTVAATLNGAGSVDLRYLIKRKPQVEKVSIVVGKNTGDLIKEQDLLFKLNLIAPGASFTEQNLQSNADQILDYLRTNGFYRSEVTFEQTPLAQDNSVGIVFKVTPNEQAKIEKFDVQIDGLTKAIPPKLLTLIPGARYTREKLDRDVEKVRQQLRKSDFVAPELTEPRVSYDGVKNTISIELRGKVGPNVKVDVVAGKEKLSESVMTRLLPIKREGTLDYAAIVEGERRLESYYQERGYFFADATPVCSVDPPLNEAGADTIPNNTEFLCSVLGSSDIDRRTVNVTYNVDRNRKLKLVNLRLKGTNLLPIEEIRTILESQAANILGVVPVFGYGRGYTSSVILERDAVTIRSLMNELGYRDAQVYVNQGVNANGDELIITFEVIEGPPTVIESVSVAGNTAIPTTELTPSITKLNGDIYSRARVRNSAQKIAEYYSERGYYNARVTTSITENTGPTAKEKPTIKVEFKIENEGRKVIVNRVLVTGNQRAKSEAILRAVPIKPGDFLKANDIYLSEQNLYSSDAFDRVDVKTETAGTTPSGDRLTDVIVSVNEQPPRLVNYGGGYSTDLGANGFFDIRHVNLMGRLWQGGARVRWSQLQQLVQFDFVNPRFMRDGGKRFAPLTISLQYQRDSTVTRFFRSAFDKGTFGVVQRIDANGNPIDQFGNAAGSPTINRLSLSAETSRTISRKNRSILFARYRFEDVRLANINSLLIKDLLIPDQRVRISGPSFTFVRDTRENCSIKQSLLELIAKGEPSDKCRYNASDPTRGNYLTIDYGLSFKQLGANTGFQKFQATYRTYSTFPKLRNTTFATQVILGLANVFSPRNSNPNPLYPDLEGILPVSERFFAGGSTTLRGFDFEEAGPRVVIVPTGTFLNSSRQPVTLQPFTIPTGGNALAVVNLEARIPVSKSIRFVPFYDGGNVFRRVGDIFNPPDVPPNDVFKRNLRALWTHTAGLGLRLKTPIGGEFAVDYGYLLRPPEFLIPQTVGPNATYRLHQGQFHFRFSQAF